jgi:hypothetical protein
MSAASSYVIVKGPLIRWGDAPAPAGSASSSAIDEEKELFGGGSASASQTVDLFVDDGLQQLILVKAEPVKPAGVSVVGSSAKANLVTKKRLYYSQIKAPEISAVGGAAFYDINEPKSSEHYYSAMPFMQTPIILPDDIPLIISVKMLHDHSMTLVQMSRNETVRITFIQFRHKFKLSSSDYHLLNLVVEF